MIQSTQPRIEPTDAELLFRFVEHRSEEAFRQLVERHGQLVAAVARRILWHDQDVEDAFQATFLVLVRRADRLRKRDSLAAWLFQVARRIALAAAERRRKRATSDDVEAEAEVSTLGGVENREEFEILAAELDRLPERYRLPLVLCYFEGRSRAEAAEHLDCTESALKARLARGRRLLRQQLMRRGVALSVAFAALHVPAATLHAGLVGSTTSAALFHVSGGTAGAAASAHTLALTRGLSSMLTLPAAKGTAIVGTTFAASLLVAATVALSQPAHDVAVGADATTGATSAPRSPFGASPVDSRTHDTPPRAPTLDATNVSAPAPNATSSPFGEDDPFSGGGAGGVTASAPRATTSSPFGEGDSFSGSAVAGEVDQLSKEITLDLDGVALRDALEWFHETTGANIVVDVRSIQRHGVPKEAVLQTPITLQLDGITARSALRIILEPLELVAVPDGEIVRVSLAPSADRAARLRNVAKDLRERVPNEERIEGILRDERATVIEFVDTPLADGIEFLARQHDIPIVIDEKGLEEIGIATDEPLNRVLSGVKLESALNLLLEPLDLAWFVENEVLVVTSRDRAKAKRTTRVYAIGPLVEAGLLEPETASDVLLDEAEGGRAVVTRNVVTITQSPLGHRRTANVLAQLVRAATMLDE